MSVDRDDDLYENELIGEPPSANIAIKNPLRSRPNSRKIVGGYRGDRVESGYLSLTM